MAQGKVDNPGPDPEDKRPFVPLAEDPPKMTNNERRAKSLRNRINHAHAYRVQNWAVMTVKIARLQAELVALGFEQEKLFEPDFTDPKLLDQYRQSGNYTG